MQERREKSNNYDMNENDCGNFKILLKTTKMR